MSLLKYNLSPRVPSPKQSNQGPVIGSVLMHQFALMEDGMTIHSSPQMEWNQVSLDDQSPCMGGQWRLLTLDGYQIPLNMCHGLAYMDMRPFTNDGWDSLPHTSFTLETPWDPWVLDLEQSDDPDWFEHVPPCSIQTLTRIVITATMSLRVWHPYLPMKGLLMIIKTHHLHLGLPYGGHTWWHCCILCNTG